MTKELYRVRYRIEGPAPATNASATVQLYSASESEAIYELKRRGTIGSDKMVIILSIERCWFDAHQAEFKALVVHGSCLWAHETRCPLLLHNKGELGKWKKWIFLTKLNAKNLVVSNGLHTFALRFSNGMKKLIKNRSWKNLESVQKPPQMPRHKHFKLRINGLMWLWDTLKTFCNLIICVMTFGLLQWNHHLFSAIFTENAYKVP